MQTQPAFPDKSEVKQVVAVRQQHKQAWVLLVTSGSAVGLRPGQKPQSTLRLLKATPKMFKEVLKHSFYSQHDLAASVNDGICVRTVQGEYSKFKHLLYLFGSDLLYQGFINATDLLNLPVLAGNEVCPIAVSLQNEQLVVACEGEVSILAKKYGVWYAHSRLKAWSMAAQNIEILHNSLLLDSKYLVPLPQSAQMHQGSLPLHHPSILQAFFFKGYSKQVCQVLVSLFQHLTEGSALLEFDSVTFIEEKPKQVVKAFNAFDAFDESESEEETKEVSDHVKSFMQNSE